MDDFANLRAALQAPITFLEPSRPFPISPTPYVIERERYEHLGAQARALLSALEKACHCVIATPNLLAQFPELKGLEPLLGLPSGGHRLIELARFDLAILRSGGFSMVEANAGCPGALSTVGDINREFAATQDYRQRFAGRTLPLRIDDPYYFVDHLAALAEGRPSGCMAFISSRHRRIVTDLDRLTALARERGYAALRCEVQDLRYDGERLRLGQEPVAVAYLKFDAVITDAGLMDLGIFAPGEPDAGGFMRALQDGAFAYVNSYASQLLAENKRLLAMLREPEVQRVLDDGERQAVEHLLPATHALGDAALARFGGRERLLDEQAHWVLKTAIESRGRGVHIGRHCSADQWRELLASEQLERFVAQAHVELDRQPVLDPADPGALMDAYTDIGLYMLGGEPQGFLCRASRDPIVNVGQRGALRPTLVLR